MSKYTESEVQGVIGNILKRAPDRKDGGGRKSVENKCADTFDEDDSDLDDELLTI